MDLLNLFYQEPDPDRWFKYDRYPRKIIRKIIRGKQRPGGVMMVAINLLKGLDKLAIPYRFNDFKHANDHPDEVVCIIGKPNLLFEKKWRNPIIFGAGVFSHPTDYPDIFKQFPNLKKILVPGEWMRIMFEAYYGDKVITWPVGIDTDIWKPQENSLKNHILIYDKIRWEYNKFNEQLLNPIIKFLESNNLSYDYIRYGGYEPDDLRRKLKNCKAAIFICEHETQGLAYQQILATDTPILAWDRSGFWQDPTYYPHIATFKNVSSVPYWDARCGMIFKDINEFYIKLPQFINACENNYFDPLNFILENLTLEKCADAYVNIVKQEILKNGQINTNSL